MTLWLGLPIVAALAIAVMLFLVWAIGPPGVPPPEPSHVPPSQPATRPAVARPIVHPRAGVRLVMVNVIDDGIVIDGIIENGTALGAPHSPVTIVLERSDPCGVSPVVQDLECWAESGALLDVVLFADGGIAAASLSDGHVEVELPILGLRS